MKTDSGITGAIDVERSRVMDSSLAMQGLFWGAVSGVSLPLGAALGLWSRPPRKVLSGLMAFGGGALLFALSLELFSHAIDEAGDGHGNIINPWIILVTMGGALVGGLLFEGLNYLLNKKGGFVRKRSLLKKHVTGLKRKTAERLMKVLSHNRLLSALTHEEIIRLTPFVEAATLEPGEILVHEGDEADAIFFIAEGRFAVERSRSTQNPIAVLEVGDVVGEIAVLSDHSRMATVRAVEKSQVLKLPKDTFNDFLARSIALKARVSDIAKQRVDNLVEKNLVDAELARALEKGRISALRKISISTTEEEIADEAGKHSGKGGGAVAIWLGNALDCIPESLVIGMLVVAAAVGGGGLSLAFIAGVFLANLPEAMSSAVTMRSGGMSIRKIMLMWGFLCLLTASGGFAGAAYFPAHPEGVLKYIVFGLEGLAAGAMLTMIAETMLPEAFEQGGGTIAGLSTLVGFLAALAIKLI